MLKYEEPSKTNKKVFLAIVIILGVIVLGSIGKLVHDFFSQDAVHATR